MTIAETLLPELDLEMATTRRVLERVPTDKGKWKPHPNLLLHHRGQLTVYLRLVDVPVPSIYGPTADEPMPGS
ncbi:MAG TPA: hypothetical protein VIM36_09930 [Gemmatimonadaceae bacterium]